MSCMSVVDVDCGCCWTEDVQLEYAIFKSGKSQSNGRSSAGKIPIVICFSRRRWRRRFGPQHGRRQCMHPLDLQGRCIVNRRTGGRAKQANATRRWRLWCGERIRSGDNVEHNVLQHLHPRHWIYVCIFYGPSRCLLLLLLDCSLEGPLCVPSILPFSGSFLYLRSCVCSKPFAIVKRELEWENATHLGPRTARDDSFSIMNRLAGNSSPFRPTENEQPTK